MNRNAERIIRDAMIEQACAWQARHLSGEMSVDEKVQFLKWLQDNAGNVREYLASASLAQLMPEALQGLEPAGADKPDNIVALRPLARGPVADAQRSRGRVWPRIAATLLMACAGTYGVLQYLDKDSLTVRVAHGDQRTVRLDDGSVVHLNSQSRVRVRYSASERLVELSEGQALFNVARDPSRPFRVRAGRAEIVAVGTQFDVYRRANKEITVTVTEGRVDVIDAGSPQPRRLRLDMGQQLRIANKPAAISKVDASAETAWTRREIIFSGRPLGEVAEEFNRYLSIPVHIEDMQLRSTRVSGMFSAYDEEAFLAFLREFDGVVVEKRRGVIEVRLREQPD